MLLPRASKLWGPLVIFMPGFWPHQWDHAINTSRYTNAVERCLHVTQGMAFDHVVQTLRKDAAVWVAVGGAREMHPHIRDLVKNLVVSLYASNVAT